MELKTAVRMKNVARVALHLDKFSNDEMLGKAPSTHSPPFLRMWMSYEDAERGKFKHVIMVEIKPTTPAESCK
eukprot:766531-Hanusia_phi.AAC.2